MLPELITLEDGANSVKIHFSERTFEKRSRQVRPIQTNYFPGLRVKD